MSFPSSHEPDFDSFIKVRYNTQTQAYRGSTFTTIIDEYLPGKYAISGNQPMLPTSRQILDQCWFRDCRYISQHANFPFAACHNASHQAVPAPSKALDIEDSTLTMSHQDRLILSGPRFHGYLHQHIRSCYLNYGIQGARSHPHFLRFHSSTQVLFVADRDDERDFLRGVLRFVYGIDVAFDTIKDSSRSWVTTNCSSARVIMTSTPMIEYSNNSEYRISTSAPCLCKGQSFKRTIIAIKDIFDEAWHKFLDTNPSVIRGTRFDNSIKGWSLWDSKAEEYLEQMKSQASTKSSFQTSADKFFIIPAYLIMDQKKPLILHRLLEFMHGNSMSKLSPNLQSCIFSLSRALYLDIRSYVYDRHFLSTALSSKGLLCIVNENYRRDHLQEYLSTYIRRDCPSRYSNASRLQTPSKGLQKTIHDLDPKSNLSQIDIWRCDMRYHRRHFIEKVQFHVIGIVANPGDDVIHARLLFEHSTGYHTGAVDSDPSLTMFAAEYACGQRLGLVHIRPVTVTVAITRGVTPAIRLPSHGRGKCGKGMIRGFTRAILLIRDPFLHIYEEYLRKQRIVRIDDLAAWRNQAITIALNISDVDLNLGHVYREMSFKFNHSNLFAVSLPALIYTSKSADTNPGIDRHQLLRSMIDFSGHINAVTTSKLHCAYSFLDIEKELVKLDDMVAAYHHARLVCDIVYILRNRFQSQIHIRHIFWLYPCT